MYNQHLIFIVIPLNIYGYLKKSENCEDLKYFWNMCSHQSIATLFMLEIYRGFS